MSITSGFAGVSNCYVFKSRLQEYAQKQGFPTPMYETVKAGPSHEPYFKSTVIVNDVKYDSLPGFSNRKAAEQSAAEVALLELLKSGNTNGSIAHPVHETGLCKNLLQEYAQKMNYAIPSYTCVRSETQGKKSTFTCTVDIGGIQYIGAAASSKKEAEIKAARTALLAIQSSPTGAVVKPGGSGELTVLPCKKKGAETDAQKEKCEKPLKPKKADFKKKHPRRKFSDKKVKQANGNTESSSALEVVNQNNLEADQGSHGSEHMETEVNLHQQVTVTEADSSQNGVTVPMHFKPEENQDGYGNAHDDHAVLEVNPHVQVSKTEANSSQNEVSVAMDLKPEANEDGQGDAHDEQAVLEGNLHQQVSTPEANTQNGVAVPMDIKPEANKDGNGGEIKLHQSDPVTEPNKSHNEVHVRNDPDLPTKSHNEVHVRNDPDLPTDETFTEAQTNDPVNEAVGVSPISQIGTTAEFPVMGNFGSELSC